MAISDCIEMAAPWSYEKVKEADKAPRTEGIITLSALRRRYWRRFATIVERGKIVSEPEYYLVKGVACDASVPSDQLPMLEALLGEYEARQVP